MAQTENVVLCPSVRLTISEPPPPFHGLLDIIAVLSFGRHHTTSHDLALRLDLKEGIQHQRPRARQAAHARFW